MEAEKTLTNEEIIRELLDLLKKNTMKEQANDVFEICTYVDGLEKKIDVYDRRTYQYAGPDQRNAGRYPYQ